MSQPQYTTMNVKMEIWIVSATIMDGVSFLREEFSLTATTRKIENWNSMMESASAKERHASGCKTEKNLTIM